jgi:SAM-dependent methyltransferase
VIGSADHGTGLVSPSDIADLAGVSRGAVSNWRRRSADFPAQVAGTPSKPLFSLPQVFGWLERHAGRTGSDVLRTVDRADIEIKVWAALNADRDRLSADAAADLVLSLAVAQKRALPAADAVPDGLSPQSVERFSSVLKQVNSDQLGTVVDFVLARLARSQIKLGADHGFVGSRTTTLLASLAGSMAAGGVLYDPACGIGAALLESVARGAAPSRVVGHDISRAALKIAAQRAELHGVPVDLLETDVLAHDADPSLRADVIIAEPPFGMRFDVPNRLTDRRFEFGTPPPMSADLAWIQHVIAHLADSGRGFVLAPPGTLYKGGAEAKIRTELVRRGCVEAVVALPGKLLPHTSIPLALWVVRRPIAGGNGSVLLIDASEVANPEDYVAAWLTDDSSLVDVAHAQLPIADVLAQDSVLTPQRWLVSADGNPDQVRSTYRNAWATIDTQSAELGAALTAIDRQPAFSAARVLTVRDLSDQEVLDIRIGRPAQSYEELPNALQACIVTAGDIRDGDLPRAVDTVGSQGHPDLTQPGDVLVTTMNVVRTCVDATGGRLPSTGVYRLRVRNDVLSPDFLAIALAGSWNERLQAGTTIQRASIKELEVPVLPMSEQERAVLITKAIRQLRNHALHVADAAHAADTALLDALRYNTSLTASSLSADSPEDADLDTTSGTK